MTDDAVRPFRIDVPQAEVDELRDRLARTRWPAPQQQDGDRGIAVDVVRELADHWRTEWDWREHETALNACDQVETTVDGTRLHALHVRSPEADAPVLVLLHGWPGSVVEFTRVVAPLAETMHVVVPSLPGYGFSGPTPDGGWTTQRMARAIAELLARLGHDRYVVHGGDWGARVARDLGAQDTAHVAGVHVTMTMGLDVDEPADDAERAAAERGAHYARELSGYFRTQSTRPLSLAPAFTDSPAGLLAWIAERFRDWTDPASDALGALRDQVLADVAVYWFTGTAPSSSQLYWETRNAEPGTWSREVPTGVCVLPHDLARPVRRAVEAAVDLVHWTELPAGGHFPAMEVPDLLVADLRTFVARVTAGD
ncbi:epoxide hydrolase family protein [Modestobacter sp. Leaf380]|uniref:epoxide hydrolase family protein n=1 Tax=Modestobacter sp. Leaf380 TaxID=1736356 RepID=UPI0006F3D84C|nr:epoxide hydrolase family protein [Modestobacter sp. Leaf380]KQS71370.1 epoxide hydrolase [Modestobacter sp. Leaf380]